MTLQTINIGTSPSSGDGDPLRTAFTKINSNFDILQGNVSALTNSVSSVSGRTGDVTITTQDIVGFSGLSLSNNTAPASSTSPGVKGQVIVSGTTMYVCTSTNVWVKTTVVTSF